MLTMLGRLFSVATGALGSSGFNDYRNFMLAQDAALGPTEKEAMRDFTQAMRRHTSFPF